jgi:hypothetical protein
LPGIYGLKCPLCGTKGLENFQYLEEIQSYRELIALKDGVLHIHGYYKVFDENGLNPRLLCKTCDGELGIPESLDLDWQ